MRQRSTRSAALIAAVAIALIGMLAVFGAGCSKDKSGQAKSGGPGAPAGGKGNTKMVAKVDGKKVTEAEVTREMGMLASQMSGNPQQMESMQGAVRKQAIDNLINKMLLEQAAVKEGIKVPEQDLNARIGDIKKQFPTEQEFTARIQSMGMTPDELRQEVEKSMTFEALMAKHTADLKAPTDADLKAFYDSNLDSFKQPEQIKASHILLTVGKDDTPAQKAEKLAKIQGLRKQLVGGADFATLASQNSDCPSKANGGDLGFFGRGQMVPPFDAAAWSLKVGQLSDVVTTDFGYHLIKVTDHKDAHDVSFEEAKPQITGYLDNQGKQAAMTTYVQGLRSTAKIEYADTTGMGK
jgi:peptidyl-prolyl cis-trans isomerase C